MNVFIALLFSLLLLLLATATSSSSSSWQPTSTMMVTAAPIPSTLSNALYGSSGNSPLNTDTSRNIYFRASGVVGKFDSSGTLVQAFENSYYYFDVNSAGEVVVYDQPFVKRYAPSGQLLTNFTAVSDSLYAFAADDTHVYIALITRILKYSWTGALVLNLTLPSSFYVFSIHVDAQQNLFIQSYSSLYKYFADGREDLTFNNLRISATYGHDIDPISQQLYRWNDNRTAIEQVSLTNGSVSDTIPLPSTLGFSPYGIALDRSDRRSFVVSANDRFTRFSRDGTIGTTVDRTNKVRLSEVNAVQVDTQNRMAFSTRASRTFITANLSTDVVSSTPLSVGSPTFAIDGSNRGFFISFPVSGQTSYRLIVSSSLLSSAQQTEYTIWNRASSSYLSDLRMTVDASGQNIFVADNMASCIMRIVIGSSTGASWSVFASSLPNIRGVFLHRSTNILYAVGGSSMWRFNAANAALLSNATLRGVVNASDVVVDSAGNAYVADLDGKQIVFVDASTNVVSVFASTVPIQLGRVAIKPEILALSSDSACLVVLDYGTYDSSRILVFGSTSQCGTSSIMNQFLSSASSSSSSSTGPSGNGTLPSSSSSSSSPSVGLSAVTLLFAVSLAFIAMLSAL